MKTRFYKYQGTGNDFVMIDDREMLFPMYNQDLVAHLCNRRFGIGADGLILLQPSAESGFYMQYYNSDGRESSMCGNGGRCIAAFAKHMGIASAVTSFMAVDGAHEAEIIDTNNPDAFFVKLKMHDVTSVERRNEHTFVLNTGSPHYVSFVHTPVNDLDVTGEAKLVRYGAEFKEQGINVNFINLVSLKEIAIRTYERGVEDETLSCGTGVTAAALSAAILNNLPAGYHTIDVKAAGGHLKVSFNYHPAGHSFTDVWLQGPALRVFEGYVEI